MNTTVTLEFAAEQICTKWIGSFKTSNGTYKVIICLFAQTVCKPLVSIFFLWYKFFSIGILWVCVCPQERERERERIYYIIARVSESPLLDGATERVLMIVPFNRTMTTTTTSMAIAQKEGGGGDGSVLMWCETWVLSPAIDVAFNAFRWGQVLGGFLDEKTDKVSEGQLLLTFFRIFLG